MGRLKLSAADKVEIDEAPAPAAAAPSRLLLTGADKVEIDDPAPAEPPKVGKVASFLRGAVQGATFGFADEITGGLRSLVSDKTYEQERDASRAAYRAAQEANPLTYGAGDIAGSVATSFVPGLGIAKGAKALHVAAKAALAGGVSGIGHSEAEDFTTQLQEGLGAAAISGATGGLLARVTRGAPERVVRRTLGDITDGVPATLRDKVVGKAGSKVDDVVDAVTKNPAIKRAGGDPQQLLGAIDGALEPVMSKIDRAYARAGSATAGIKVNDVQQKLFGIVKELEANPGTRGLARAVRSQIDDVFESWVAPATTGGKGFVVGDPRVSANDVRKFASSVADTAFFGSPGVPPKAGREVAQRVWGELKTLIDRNIDDAAKSIGGAGATELRDLNRKASTLIQMRQAAQYRATREATDSTRLKDRISGGLDLGLALVDPTTFVAKKAYDFVGKPLVRAADSKLAEIVTAARAGSKPAQITQMAIEMGMGRATGEALGAWAARKFGGAEVSADAGP